VEPGSKCVVFGLGGIGLKVIQGLRLAGADMIIGVDINNGKKEWGERFGMTHFVNPKEVGSDLVAHLVNMTKPVPTRSAAPTTPSIAPAMSP
jgi:S-(hydroxymethyl)glutathione dehydrogenase / alcohol dehydrogenase